MEQVNCLVMTGIGGGSFRGVKILRCKNRQWQERNLPVASFELPVASQASAKAKEEAAPLQPSEPRTLAGDPGLRDDNQKSNRNSKSFNAEVAKEK